MKRLIGFTIALVALLLSNSAFAQPKSYSVTELLSEQKLIPEVNNVVLRTDLSKNEDNNAELTFFLADDCVELTFKHCLVMNYIRSENTYFWDFISIYCLNPVEYHGTKYNLDQFMLSPLAHIKLPRIYYENLPPIKADAKQEPFKL